MKKIDQLVKQLENSNKALGNLLKKSEYPSSVQEKIPQEEMQEEENQEKMPQVGIPQEENQEEGSPEEKQEGEKQEEGSDVDPQTQEIVELLDSIPKEMIPSILEALQSKMEEPDVNEMAKSYKAMQSKIESLEKSLQQLSNGVIPKIIPSKTKTNNIDVFEKNTSMNKSYGDTGPRMLRKSALVDKLKRDPKTKSGVLLMATDLPENDNKALKDFYDLCESRGINLPLE